MTNKQTFLFNCVSDKQGTNVNIGNIKHDLRNGILFLCGYFSILVQPGMPEFKVLNDLGRRGKKYSDLEKKLILKKIVETIENII